MNTDHAQDLQDINEMVTEQSERIGWLQRDLHFARWWRRPRIRRDLTAAINEWIDLVDVQESIWRDLQQSR
jgi:hypothetical protein